MSFILIKGLVSNWISNVRLQTALAAGFPSIAQQAELVQAAGATDLTTSSISPSTMDNGNLQSCLTGRSSSAPSSPQSGRSRAIADRQIIPARIISSDNEDGVEVDVE